ncbi:ABC transporter ATP-binding protein [Ferrovibrio sp. MS7]|uniref:ABC transporter ATP-binding protein n=1 Tax=Ferrovibrio plantarum TaxID=3119164 RepID=UPI001B414368|nr:ABC transporter ATP-binding protein [Ferrovibrio sp.]
MPDLILRDVSHRYGDRLAVDHVALAIGAGEIFCLLGPSGCGKSTTLRIAAGLEDLQQGEVSISGRRVAGPGLNLPTEARHVGMVFQDHALFPHLSVADNIAFGLSQLGAAERRQRAELWAGRVGLTAHLDVFPHRLSGGEQQRVALARALAPEPAVMLLDEPFSSLDNRLRDQIRDDTVAILKQAGTPTLLVTHDPEEAMRMADRIGIMQAGRLVQVDSPEGVYGQPQSLFAARFLSETNEIKGRVQAGRLDTPFGTFPAPHLADGTEALLVFRPEALAVQNSAELGGADLDCRVLRARSLGPYRRVEVQLNGAGETHLVARLAPGPLPEAGSRLRLTLDKAACHIFPSS